METPERYFDPQLIARLHGLRLRASHVVEGFVAGLHRSPFRGFSIEFAEHRNYAPGDDPRYLDWKVLARSDRFVVKRYEDETNLVCHMLLDVSESMTYRSELAPWSKLEYAQCALAALAYLILLGQDAVGVMSLDDEIRAQLPASRSAEQLRQLLEILEQPGEPTFSFARRPDLSAALHRAAEQLQRRGVVLLISDLLDDPDRLLGAFAALRRQRQDLIVMHLQDPAEEQFPFDSPTLFHGLEGIEDLVIDAHALRAAYLEAQREHAEMLKQGCLAEGVDYVAMRTDQPLDEALASYLARRAQRVR
ncbi:MAG: DUF58 domain-containing protein [Planctomycetales bacterium]|nr:DUF58 domain-containing protein [Planctomycetales bacterium]